MPKRKPKYPDKPHVTRPEIRARFEALMKPEVVAKLPKQPVNWNNPKWGLWRWDTLEDVAQE